MIHGSPWRVATFNPRPPGRRPVRRSARPSLWSFVVRISKRIWSRLNWWSQARVWLERPGSPNPLDDVLLDRLAIAAAAAVERYGPAHTTMADPALVELVVSSDSDEAARARALRLLGFAADLPVHVIAVRSQLLLDRIGGLVCPARPVKAAPLADLGVILAAAIDPAGFPADVRAGIGAAESPGRSWRQARTALRFTTPREPVIRYDDQGALALLAEIPPDTSRDNTDVAAITRVAATMTIWRPWTPTARPAPSAEPPAFSICSTAASPADSNRSARPLASNSQIPPDCYAPESPLPHGACSTAEGDLPRHRGGRRPRHRPVYAAPAARPPRPVRARGAASPQGHLMETSAGAISSAPVGRQGQARGSGRSQWAPVVQPRKQRPPPESGEPPAAAWRRPVSAGASRAAT